MLAIEEQVLVVHEVCEQTGERDGLRSIPVLIEKVDLPLKSREQLKEVPRLG